MMRANPDRPNLIVAITDSIDAISTLTSEAVRDIARQSSATMHISWVTMSMWDSPPAPVGVTNWPLVYWESAHEREVPFNCGTTGACQPNHRSWVPYYELFGPRRELHDIGNLREATALTGGAIHAPGIFAERNAAAVFQKVFEDYRRSYLLRYTPQGVSHEGWHEISVQIPAHAGYEIHSRRGYAIDTSTPATVPHADTAPGSNPAATIADLTSAYGRADYAVALTTMRQFGDRAKLIRDFRAAGNPWPATPRREALFVMELAEAALAAHRADATDAARGLLTTYSKLVRQPLEPDAFEHDWLLAELAILEGTIQPALAQSFAANALARFPDEPRVLLAQAILADQRWPLGTFDGLGASTTAVVNDVTARYDAAIAHDGTAFEARVRKAWLLHRLRNDPAALTLLDAATAATATSAPAPDAVLRYLQQLIRGHVLDALGRLDAAIDAYRAALVIQPGTQSARVALMNALVKKGDRDEARTLAEAIQTAPAGTPDPWWLYWQGDYRLYPGLIAQLRQKAFVP
jgi:tetratricopeptide (TPR) repeat protein